MDSFQEKDKEFKKQQEHFCNKRHKAKPLPEIQDRANVWVKTTDHQEPGQVLHKSAAPRSYIVETQT